MELTLCRVTGMREMLRKFSSKSASFSDLQGFPELTSLSIKGCKREPLGRFSNSTHCLGASVPGEHSLSQRRTSGGAGAAEHPSARVAEAEPWLVFDRLLFSI